MWWMLAAAALQGYSDGKNAEYQAKVDNILGRYKQKIQEENNASARSSANDKQTVTSLNIRRSMQNYINADASIDVAKMRSRSESIVNAAAGGTAGLSVNDSIMDIERNAARAEAGERDTLQHTVSELQRGRRQIEAEMQGRIRNDLFIPSEAPSAASAALDAGVRTAANTYGQLWDFGSLKGRLGGGTSTGLSSVQASRT